MGKCGCSLFLYTFLGEWDGGGLLRSFFVAILLFTTECGFRSCLCEVWRDQVVKGNVNDADNWPWTSASGEKSLHRQVLSSH